MTSRERVEIALRHGRPDRVPLHESFWQATTDQWRQEGLPPGVGPESFFDTDLRFWGFDHSFGLPTEVIERTEESVVLRDGWGTLKRDWVDRRSTPELLDFLVKSRADWDRLKGLLRVDRKRVEWGSVRAALAQFRAEGKFVALSLIPGYEAAWRKVGVERMMMAIAEDPDWVRDIYAHDTELIISMTELCLAEGLDFDGVWFADDLGYRNGLLFSPRAYREQLFPYHRQICDYMHSRGKLMILHSCGRVLDDIPMLIEAGFDCLQPLEVKAGMDLAQLVREYGKYLAFMGGVDVRAFWANEAELKREVREKLAVGMSNPGGYIFHSDHSIPTQVSLARYAKVVKLVRQHGNYR